MANTYTWEIDSLECVPSLDGQTNVVSIVNWRAKGTNGTHVASIHGQQFLTYTPESSFIAYDDLTLPTVIEWVQTDMGAAGVAAIELALDSQIINLENPPIVTFSLPWKQFNA
jgi:hypothetical protein